MKHTILELRRSAQLCVIGLELLSVDHWSL